MKHLPRLFLLLPLALGLAGCESSAPPPPQSFPPLDYSYLPPITLKVAAIYVNDEYLPDPQAAQLISEDPEAPALALEAMAHSRLVADGSPGTATFVIKRASLNEVGGMLEGDMDVELNISTSNGQRVAYAEASVSRSVTAPSNDSQDEMRAALYTLTKNLMTDMNVQFQYQVQRSLGDWLAFPPNAAGFGNATLAPPLNPGAGIQSQPLPNPAPSQPPLPQPQMQLTPAAPPPE